MGEQVRHLHLLHLCSCEVEHLQQAATAQGCHSFTRHLQVLMHSSFSSSSPYLVALGEVQGPQPPPQSPHHLLHHLVCGHQV